MMNDFSFDSIKAIIFDMDGVLLDTESVCDKTWKKAAKEFGVKNSKKAINLCRGTNENDSIRILSEFYGKDFPSKNFLTRASELFHEIERREGIKTMFYAEKALSVLKKKYRIALASSTRKESVVRELKNAGLLENFETITSGDMVLHSKPAPDIYIKAFESLNLLPNECVAVEDSPNGIRSAKNAGMKAIMIPDRIKPDEEMKKLSDKIFKDLKAMTKFLITI